MGTEMNIRIPKQGLPMHQHWCVGGCNHPGHPGFSRVHDCESNPVPLHPPHPWDCYRPGCTEGRDYICGIYADALQGSSRGGKTTAKIRSGMN